MARVLTIVACMAIGLAGCGSTTTPPSTSSSGSYEARVKGCLDDVGLQLARAGNATSVVSAAGRVANLHFFPVERAARTFYKQLAVAGAYGGKAVAIFLGPGAADASDRRVVADCLTP